MTDLLGSAQVYELVGMLDSPFVRRVAIALHEYGLPFRNLALRTVGDAEQFAHYSPLKRAPTLVLPDGQRLYDSHLILSYLDELVGEGVALWPTAGPERLLCLQVVGVAAGLADKAVSGVYEKAFHPPAARHPGLLARIRGQVDDCITWLETRAPEAGFLTGERLSHADVVVGTALCFAREVHPEWLQLDQAPRLSAWCARLDALPVFQATYLAVEPPEA